MDPGEARAALLLLAIFTPLVAWLFFYDRLKLYFLSRQAPPRAFVLKMYWVLAVTLVVMMLAAAA